MTITSFFALAPADDVWAKWTIIQKILFMCLVGFALTTTRERVNQLIWVVVLSIGIWGVKGAILFPLHGGGSGIHGPDGGVTAANNEFGVALVMLLPLLYYQWHYAVNRHLRLGLSVMGLLVTLAVIFTYSRGALLGACAMGAMLWLRSPAKLSLGFLIIIAGLIVYNFAPANWFNRMETIETYQDDSSATGRINIWKASLRIAELRPILGGGFRVTFWPNVTNPMLSGTDIPRLEIPRAAHSIYFDVLSEHGWPGLALFLMIGACSWLNCSWLIRRSRNRPEFAWANLLGRMGQGLLLGYWVAGAFASLAYFDEYWCALFIFDAARRIVAKEIASPAAAFTAASVRRPSLARPGIAPIAVAKSE
jgi:probable O-glycosylation ligase (exosortase A-associated)